MAATDRIYAAPLRHVGDFVFDERVVDVFPDMISRSVPGYGSVVAMTVELADQFVRPGSSVYDLGCSLGATTLPISQRIAEDAVIYAVDSSPAMIAGLSDRLAGRDYGCRVEPICEDIRGLVMYAESADLVIMNFTLQFIPPPERDELIHRIATTLRPGGAFVLSEKICFDDPSQQNLMTSLHHAFKRAHGYSELEIAQKRTALENTLIPETLASHSQRMHRAGFSGVTPWFQCLNFASFLALK
jgi:tRNA (cmo5U34)-methyltransferase